MVLDACCMKHGSGNYEMTVIDRGSFGLVFSPYSPAIHERKRE